MPYLLLPWQDRRILTIYYDLPGPLHQALEAKIIDAVHVQLDKHFRSPIDGKKTGRTRPLSPQQSLTALHITPNLGVDLVAAKPLVKGPVAIDWGTDGRLWVAEMVDYPMGSQVDYKPGFVTAFLIGSYCSRNLRNASSTRPASFSWAACCASNRYSFADFNTALRSSNLLGPCWSGRDWTAAAAATNLFSA